MCVVGQLGKPSPGLELTYGKTCTWYGTLCWSKLIQSKECERFWKKTFFSLDELQEMSKFKEILEVMEARQRWQRGLLHILDEVYLFFMELEQRKVDLLNVYVLRKQHENMVEAAVVLQGTKNWKNAECNVFQVKRLTGARYVTCALLVP